MASSKRTTLGTAVSTPVAPTRFPRYASYAVGRRACR
jgi:hypothetical protein